MIYIERGPFQVFNWLVVGVFLKDCWQKLLVMLHPHATWANVTKRKHLSVYIYISFVFECTCLTGKKTIHSLSWSAFLSSKQGIQDHWGWRSQVSPNIWGREKGNSVCVSFKPCMSTLEFRTAEKITRSNIVSIHTHIHYMPASHPESGWVSDVQVTHCACVCECVCVCQCTPSLEERADGPSVSLQ